MADIEVIVTRLQKLDVYLRRLRQLASVPLDEYLQNKDLQAIVERRLQLAIQVCIDLANYLVAHHGLRVPDAQDNVFVILGEEKVIPSDLARRMAGMVRFRNILVHDYLEIDSAIVHKLLTTRLGDFDEFGQAMLRLFGIERSGVEAPT